jgi:hypothetical protein
MGCGRIEVPSLVGAIIVGNPAGRAVNEIRRYKKPATSAGIFLLRENP